jgi:hypothetical protein
MHKPAKSFKRVKQKQHKDKNVDGGKPTPDGQ